ncbi:MAG: hypothetical protein WC677_05780 [Clostridia bacterium]
MKIEKVVKTRKVRVPTKTEVLNDCSLLRILPKRWQKNKIVIAAVTSLLAISMTSCDSGNIKIAPVFKHGVGSSYSGGMSGGPMPINEDEAKKIIIKEANLLGLKLVNKEIKIDQVSVPTTSIVLESSAKLWKISRYDNAKFKLKKPASFNLDLESDNGTVGIEYVSMSDYYDWSVPEENASTASSSKPLKAAEVLVQDGFKNAKSDKVKAIGVFYDPSEEKSVEMLKEQVADFVKWLKGQGLI